MKLLLLAVPILAFTIIGSDRVIDNPLVLVQSGHLS